MMILIALLLGYQAGLKPTQHCGPVILDGVSWTQRGRIGFWVRSRSQVDDSWSLNILRVSDAQGAAFKTKAPLDYLKPSGLNSIAGVSLADPPAQVKVQGELVHYQSVEERATFPPVALTSQQGGTQSRAGSPAFRVWEIPEGPFATTKTPKGLGLTFYRLNMAGYSGPGFDDLSRFPVRVLPNTLGKDERVDAMVVAGDRQTIYQKNPPINGAIFTFREKQAYPAGLPLQIRRMSVDKRFAFSLNVAVQRDKDPFSGASETTKVAWPAPMKSGH